MEKKTRKPRTKKVKATGKIDKSVCYGVAIYDPQLDHFYSLVETFSLLIKPKTVLIAGEGLVQYAFPRDPKLTIDEDARRNWHNLSK